MLHVGHRHRHLEVQQRRRGGIDDLHLPVAAEEARGLLKRAHGGGQADALGIRGAPRRQPFQGQGQMGAALGRSQCVDLVHDQGVDRRKVRRGLGAQDQVQGLGRRDQDLRGLLELALALPLRRIAGAHCHARQPHRLPQRLRRACDAGKGRAQVALDVVDQGLEGGDVEYAHTCAFIPPLAAKAVDAPQEGGQGLAASSGSGDERVPARGDHRPAETLRLRGP